MNKQNSRYHQHYAKKPQTPNCKVHNHFVNDGKDIYNVLILIYLLCNP